MFGFFKKKLKDAVNRFAKKVEEEPELQETAGTQEEVTKEVPKKEIQKVVEEEESNKEPEKQHVERIIKEKTEIKEPKKISKSRKKVKEKIEKHDVIEVPKVQVTEETEKPKGFFGKLFQKKPKEKSFLSKISDIPKITLSESKFNDLFWDLEVTLLENNVAVEVIDKIKQDLKEELTENKISRNTVESKITNSLRNSIEGLFDTTKLDLIKSIKEEKPYVIAVIGVNGSGKTTTIAKLINLLQKSKLQPVVAACDTFRAAAIHQLEEHTKKLKVKLIKHDYGSDPAAVAFDAIEHAKAKKMDVVLIDTAGRLHSNKNLMQELEKVIRVAQPNLKIFVGESIAGNDVVEQVRLFNDKVGIDAIILAKADIDEKGGSAISVSYITRKPILYLGTGQNYDDLIVFDKDRIIEQLGLA